jgi:aminoglycoside phosphotransferase (APT) family kinase protein
VPVDDAADVSAGVTAWLARTQVAGPDVRFATPLERATGGMTTFVWFGELAGPDVPQSWRAPLALRMYPSSGDGPVATREAAVLAFVAEAGYPVPRPLAIVDVGGENPFGTPWMIQPRAPGVSMLDALGARPTQARHFVHDLARLEARLHRIPVVDAPLPYDGPLVDRWLDQYGPDIASFHDSDADRVVDGLRRRRAIVADEDPVLCHGDLHPLNVVSERTADGWSHVIIDWTDAVLGDRHYDVARTLGIYRIAAVTATNRVERTALRAFGPWAARAHQRVYAHDLPLDSARLAYWTAAHLVRGWGQVRGLDRAATLRTSAAAAVPPALAPALLRGAQRALRVVERG